MNKVLFLFFTLIIIGSCTTEGIEPPVNNEPIFEISATLAGEELIIAAGKEGYQMQSNFQEDSDGNINYISSFDLVDGQQGRQLKFVFDAFPKMTNVDDLATYLTTESIPYSLNFTGVEGLSLLPFTDDINMPFTTSWSIGSQPMTTTLMPLIKLAELRGNNFVNVQYNINISDQFKGSFISNFNLELTSSCNALIEFQPTADKLELTLASFTQFPNMISWNNGETSKINIVDLEAQEISVDISSDFCDLAAQIEIINTEIIPARLGFDQVLSYGPANEFVGKGLIIEYVDELGVEYRSDHGEQTDFLIDVKEVRAYETNNAGQATVIADMLVNCKLFTLDSQNSIDLKDAELSIAIAYPQQ
jgi:hypothetical protein